MGVARSSVLRESNRRSADVLISRSTSAPAKGLFLTQRQIILLVEDNDDDWG